jgi:hypothetical protein
VVGADVCFQRHGIFRGANSTCGADTCAPPADPTGACCIANPTTGGFDCSVIARSACRTAHGIFRGPNTDCATSTCPPPPPTGACCVYDATGVTCQVVTARACAELHGRFRGPNTNCDTPCPAPVNCDWNGDGSVTIDDLVAFIEDYRAGDADINGDGVTNEADLIAFIDCFRRSIHR